MLVLIRSKIIAQPALKTKAARISVNILGMILIARPAVNSRLPAYMEFLTPSFLIIFPPMAEKIAPETTSAEIGAAATISGEIPNKSVFCASFNACIGSITQVIFVKKKIKNTTKR